MNASVCVKKRVLIIITIPESDPVCGNTVHSKIAVLGDLVGYTCSLAYATMDFFTPQIQCESNVSLVMQYHCIGIIYTCNVNKVKQNQLHTCIIYSNK